MHISPKRHRPTALEGRDGWLFLDGDSNRVVEQHTGRRRLTRRDLDRWAATLEQRAERASARDIRYFTFIAPDKESVYPEHLPYRPVADRPIHQVQAHVSQPVTLLEPALVAAKHEGIVYPKTDTHWSSRGAHVALREMARHIGPDLEPVTGIDWSVEELEGDLGEKCDPPRRGLTENAVIRSPNAVRTFDNDVVNRGTIRVFEREDGAGPRAMLFGDSFCYRLLPLLAESCSHMVFAHSITVDWDLVDEIQPEILICLAVERFCIKPPNDDAGASVRSVAGAKLRQLRRP